MWRTCQYQLFIVAAINASMSARRGWLAASVMKMKPWRSGKYHGVTSANGVKYSKKPTDSEISFMWRNQPAAGANAMASVQTYWRRLAFWLAYSAWLSANVQYADNQYRRPATAINGVSSAAAKGVAHSRIRRRPACTSKTRKAKKRKLAASW
jgi:hypothetical protein